MFHPLTLRSENLDSEAKKRSSRRHNHSYTQFDADWATKR